jgi:hypothetical protein
MYLRHLHPPVSDTDELLAEVNRLTDEEVRAGDTERGEPGRDETESEPTRPAPEAETSPESRSLRDRLPSPSRPSVPTVLTPQGLLLTLALTVAGFLVGGFVPLVGGVTGLLGIAVAGFALGALGRARYLELALAGAATGATAFFLDRLVLSTLAGFAVPLTLVGGTAGLLAAVLGGYSGRDLRDGLTRDV